MPPPVRRAWEPPAGLRDRLPAVGTMLGNYCIDSFLGRGAQAVVFLAEDVVLRRFAAVKVFTAPRVSSRLVDEGRVIARLCHPNIVQVYHLDLASHIRYMAMEFVGGGDLVDRVKRVGPLSPRHALERVDEVLAGLAHAHDTGVVHRDLKPQNLLGGLARAMKIADFGLAASRVHLVDAQNVELVGTPLYMAPEIWQGEAPSAASDIYSLGCVLYFMLTGRPPYPIETREGLRRAHIEATPRLPDTVPAPLSRLVCRLMAADTTRRPIDASEAQEVVAECAAELGLTSPRAAHSGTYWRAEDTPARRAEAAIIDLPPFDRVLSTVVHAVNSGATLVVAAADPMHTLGRGVSRVLDSDETDVCLAARVQLERGETRRIDRVVTDLVNDSPGLAGRDAGPANPFETIVKAFAPDDTRRVLSIQVDRALLESESEWLAQLVGHIRRDNLCIVLACGPDPCNRLQALVEARGHSHRAEFVRAPALTPEQGRVHARYWIRAAGIPANRHWSPSGLALAAQLSAERPHDILRVLQNAERVAKRLGMPVLTTWCLRAAERASGTLTEAKALAPGWDARPRRWPDEAEWRRWESLVHPESSETSVDASAGSTRKASSS